MADRLYKLESKLQSVVKRAEAAESANESLTQQTMQLKAALDAQTRLSDEKINQEIRERSELQMQVRISEREASTEAQSLQSLTAQVVQLQRALDSTRQTTDQIVGSVEIAEKADGKAEYLQQQLEEATAAAAREREALAEKGNRMEEAVGLVRNELLSNAEQVGRELRLRVTEIQNVEAQERSDANAAVEASQALAERLGELSNELRNAEGLMQEEVAERKAAEVEAQAARDEMKSALIGAQEAAAAEAADEIRGLKSELDVRKRAEEALQVMLAAAHEQQGQLEDVGSAHQAATAETFDDLRSALTATNERVAAEERAREAGLMEADRQLGREAQEREAGVQRALDAAKVTNAETEQVLRTEIRARMKGEEKLSLQTRAVADAAATATLHVRTALDEQTASARDQIKMLSTDIGEHKGHIEAELAISAGRVEAVATQSASSLASLHKDHQILTKATRSAVNTLKTRFDQKLSELEARRIKAEEAMHAELTASIEDHAAEAHARLSATEETLMGKIEDLMQSVAEERSERKQAIADTIAAFDAKLAAFAEETRAAQAKANGRIDESFRRLDVTDVKLDETADELRAMDARIEEAAQVAAQELQSQIDMHSAELETVGSQLESQGEMILVERSARSEAVRNCAEAAADALAIAADEAAQATMAVSAELTRVDESQKASLNDLRFKIDHNFKAIEQTLDDYQVHAAEQLRSLENNWAHQLQHGLDALGANLEHLLETGIALEAMARSDADASLEATSLAHYDSLESQLLELRSSAAASLDELATSSEVASCMSYLIATLEEEEARAEREATSARLDAEVTRATTFEEGLSARLVASDSKHTQGTSVLAEGLRELGVVRREEADAMREAIEANRNQIVVSGARHKRELEEERDERIAGIEENELLAREIERKAEEAEVRTVLSEQLLSVEIATLRSSTSEEAAAIRADAAKLRSHTDERLASVAAEAMAEATTIRLVAQTAETDVLTRLEDGLGAMRSDHERLVGELREEHVEKIEALGEHMSNELWSAKAELDTQTDDKIAAQLKTAEEKEACEEAVQRMIEALEEREQYEADASRREQLMALEKEMNERRDRAIKEAEEEKVAAAKRAEVLENEVIKLSAKLDKSVAGFEEESVAAKAALAASVLATKSECNEMVDELKTKLAEAGGENTEKVAAAEKRSEAAEKSAERAEAAVQALKEGLGLGGLGVTGPDGQPLEGGKLASTAELGELRSKVEAELAKVQEELERAQKEYAEEARELRRTKEEALVLKSERMKWEKEDAEKDARKAAEGKALAEDKARSVAEDAEAKLAAREAKDEAKRAEAERIRQAQAKKKEADGRLGKSLADEGAASSPSKAPPAEEAPPQKAPSPEPAAEAPPAEPAAAEPAEAEPPAAAAGAPPAEPAAEPAAD